MAHCHVEGSMFLRTLDVGVLRGRILDLQYTQVSQLLIIILVIVLTFDLLIIGFFGVVEPGDSH